MLSGQTIGMMPTSRMDSRLRREGVQIAICTPLASEKALARLRFGHRKRKDLRSCDKGQFSLMTQAFGLIKVIGEVDLPSKVAFKADPDFIGKGSSASAIGEDD